MQTYRLGGGVSIEEDLEDYQYSQFVNLEFSSIDACYADDSLVSARILLGTLDLDFEASTIYSLGKGFYFDEARDLLLISSDRNSAAFDRRNIIAAFSGLRTGRQRGCLVRSRAPHSRRELAEHAYRRVVEGDPRTRGRAFSERFVSQLVEPLVHEAFGSAGQLLVHGAALEREGSGMLVLGPQNVGKTTATLALARSGWNLLGDDFVRVEPELTLAAYPKPLKIERELISGSSDVAAAVRAASVADPALAGRGILTGRGRPFEVKVPAQQLGISVSKTATLRAIFFLRRVTSSYVGPTYHELSQQDCINLLLQHQESEFRGNKHLYRDARNHLSLHHATRWPEEDSLLREQVLCENLAMSCPSYVVTVHRESSEHIAWMKELAGQA